MTMFHTRSLLSNFHAINNCSTAFPLKKKFLENKAAQLWFVNQVIMVPHKENPSIMLVKLKEIKKVI